MRFTYEHSCTSSQTRKCHVRHTNIYVQLTRLKSRYPYGTDTHCCTAVGGRFNGRVDTCSYKQSKSSRKFYTINTHHLVAVKNPQSAELGRNSICEHDIQPEYGDEQDAGRNCRTNLVRPTISIPVPAHHEQDWQPYSVDPYPC